MGDKIKTSKQKMRNISLEERLRTFKEVPLGYNFEEALAEAKRCIQCKKPKCVEGCPVCINIPEFIKLIQQGDLIGAVKCIKRDNALPAICGRVCPQEEQCEIKCILGIKGEPIAIGRLERFVADYERNAGMVELPEKTPAKNKKIAVIGSGPAGLTVAGELILKGYEVTIFEALHKPGGVLVYGIPEFRLPKTIVEAEIDYLKRLGVEIKCNHIIGRIFTIEELFKDGYEAIFIGTGAGLPKFLNIPGENLCGVFSANEFLTRVNLMNAYEYPNADTPVYVGKKVAVLGAGNTAMDSARTAVRLGAKEVYIVYRRSRAEVPARKEEVEHAQEEGVIFNFLVAPIKIIGDEKGWVKGLECLKMQLGEPDSSGRARPVPIEGSEYIMDVDMVINAIGSGTNNIAFQGVEDIQRDKHGHVIVQDETGRTTKIGVYAGGDVVTGAATVILAMGAGKSAAKAIDEYLSPKY